ncbi:MAG: polysaccharide deacetylase family protein [Bacteroidetes bacterium]|nr:polysaccharide deacetylase family protein [Bacteroidota bacterium]
MLVAVNFHYIRPYFDAPYPGIFGVTPNQFRQQLETISTMGRFVHQDDIINSIQSTKELSGNNFIITFDDGLSEQYEFALPILDEMGIPVIMYANTENLIHNKISTVHKIHLLLSQIPLNKVCDFIDKKAKENFSKELSAVEKISAVQHYNFDEPQRAHLKYLLNFLLTINEQEMIIEEIFTSYFPNNNQNHIVYFNQNQVKDLMKRGYCGTHSHRHIPLGRYSDAEVKNDIELSIKTLNEISGLNPKSISYPYGSADAITDNVCKIAKQTGLEFGFTMERAGNTNFNNPLALARFDCNDLPSGKFPLFGLDEFIDKINYSSRKY